MLSKAKRYGRCEFASGGRDKQGPGGGRRAPLRRRFGGSAPRPAAWDDQLFWNVEASRADRCQFLAIGNAINFRFWTLAGGQVIPAAGPVGGESFREPCTCGADCGSLFRAASSS